MTSVTELDELRARNGTLLEKVRELEAERKTDESLTLLETLQSTAPVGFGFVDRDYRVRWMNETLAAVNGDRSLEDQIGQRVCDTAPDLWRQIEPLYRQVLETGEPVLNHEIRAGDAGAEDVLLGSYYPVRVGAEIVGIGVVVIDITERINAEEFRSVVMDNMAEGLCVSDSHGRLVFMNSAASRMLGWTKDELLGKRIHEAIHFQHADGSDFPVEECPLFKVRTEAITTRSLDDTFTTKAGALLPIAYSAAPLGTGESIRGSVVVFRDITDEKAERTRRQRELNALTWVGRIREALDEKRFVLYSQPIFPLKEGLPHSEELLLRMVGRDGKIIPAKDFLPSAEKYGQIVEVDRWVVVEAIRRAASGRRVEANLSAESTGSADLLPLIEAELKATSADPANIVFELTETALMENLERGEAFAQRLVDLGCGIALDDFGTGFGCFTYLKKLPIALLKIDLDFVHDLPRNEANQHVVKAIVSLAVGFGQKTIAEGVEDAETLELLREYGVDFAQGHHLGRPAPLASAGAETGSEPLLHEAVIVGLEELDGDVLPGLVSLYFDEAASRVAELSGAIDRGETLTVSQTAHKLKGSSAALGATHVVRVASELEATARGGDLTVAGGLLDRLRSGLDETRNAFDGRVATS
jgi:PAS domain S-box-containing protein